jgi:hypothetical protein
VVDAGVGGDDQCEVCVLQCLLQWDAREAVVGECGDVRVVVAQLRAERGQQREDLQCGGLADVAYTWLVADAEDRDARALDGSVAEPLAPALDAAVGAGMVVEGLLSRSPPLLGFRPAVSAR